MLITKQIDYSKHCEAGKTWYTQYTAWRHKCAWIFASESAASRANLPSLLLRGIWVFRRRVIKQIGPFSHIVNSEHFL